jgi:mersacidin/lichenicidin family type 2 lantibiotic
MAANAIPGNPGRSSGMPTHPLAESYQRWILDILIVLANGVYRDYDADPRRFRELPEEDLGTLRGFRAMTGSSPNMPDTAERTRYYSSRFGYPFWVASAQVRQTAIAIVEQPSPGREDIQRQMIEDAAAVLRAHLTTLADKTPVASDREIADLFERAVALFKSQAIGQAFGTNPISADRWPYDKTLDADAAYLIETIARAQNYLPQDIDQRKFLELQRVAHYGARTVASVLNLGRQDDVDEVIRSAYGWAKALQVFVPDIVRAWKVPQYRKSLGNLEQSLVPDHPAGTVDLGPSGLESLEVVYGDAIPLEAQGTYTVSGEVCCCDSVRLCDTYAPICDPLQSLTGLCWPF